MNTAYTASNVYFRYAEEWVIEDVSFNIYEGEFIGIIGPNGSGKSSLLKLMAKIHIPQSGNICLRGTDISLLKRYDLSRTFSYVPQESSFLFPYTVSEVVSMGRVPHLRGKFFENTYDKNVVTTAMTLVGIDTLKDRAITDISGGEKQRAIVARAIAQEPEILIMDEPATSLDIGHQIEIFDLLARLNIERKLTVIASMHDLNLGSLYCHRLILMSRGRIVAVGRPSDVITEDNIRDVYGCNIILDKHPVSGTPRVTIASKDIVNG